ncbi:MAG: hypothetical protein ISS63_15325 [Desulfobacteraceae bacterium]|nr:hypothetical protein [Desulfobacteraceae bacterium]
MSALPDYKTIADLIKRGMTVEAQEKIMQLREAAVNLKEDNLSLRERITRLEAQLDVQDRLEWDPPYYWLKQAEDRDGPYCQNCYDTDRKLIRLQSRGKGAWNCLACKNSVFDQDYTPPKRPVRRTTRV